MSNCILECVLKPAECNKVRNSFVLQGGRRREYFVYLSRWQHSGMEK